MNVVNLQNHQVNTLDEQLIDKAATPLAKLIGVQSQQDTEQLWKKRLNLYLKMERKVLKVKRLRKVSSIVTSMAVGTLVFSLYMAPTLNPVVFISLLIVIGLGVSTFPAWVLLGRNSQLTRDSISRKFYESNHELEIAEGKITLISRANYANVTHVNISDFDLGQSSH